jgi:xanthine/CO dehydrogenase XdhC/CoxF family maturation factor
MYPDEVAFFIMAEIMMIKNGGTGKPPRDLKTAPQVQLDRSVIEK